MAAFVPGHCGVFELVLREVGVLHWSLHRRGWYGYGSNAPEWTLGDKYLECPIAALRDSFAHPHLGGKGSWR